jgi:sialate O-acetylesterase
MLYNGMVHGLLPFPIRGAIWYQGESNHGEGMLYRDKMEALIAGWRKIWDNAEMPFLFVQLAPYQYGNEDPLILAKCWEAQTAALEIPHTGMAVTTDIGNTKDIHPRNKQDVGGRLALWALAKTYGRDDLVYSGPLYKSMSVEGDKVRLRFEHVGGGLKSRDGEPLSWFEIAGDDNQFAPAQAKIDGDTVVVGSDAVEAPTAVRFGFHKLAEPNLMNAEGLPASPFRTDR